MGYASPKIHVLADETLGGVMREYEETNHGYGGVVSIKPTHIVHIDGTRYRMVDRKAAVGERVIIVEAGSHDFAVGDITEIKRVTDNGVDEQTRLGDAEYGWLYEEEYLVLESVESETSPQSTDDIIANLVRRVSSLERQVTELERENKAMLDVYERGQKWTHERINGVKDDIETWAQEVEKVRRTAKYAEAKVHKVIRDVDDLAGEVRQVDDKIEMCIDDIVTLDERTEYVNPIKARRCCGC